MRIFEQTKMFHDAKSGHVQNRLQLAQGLAVLLAQGVKQRAGSEKALKTASMNTCGSLATRQWGHPTFAPRAQIASGEGLPFAMLAC